MIEGTYIDDKRYIVGVIGDIPALLTFWQLFREESSEETLREIGVVAIALPGDGALPVTSEVGNIPTYAGFKTMLAKHPEINMVIEATGRPGVVHELRSYLPPSITLVERGAASLFINLLASDKIWVACKADLMHTQLMLRTIMDQLDLEMLFLDRDGRIVGLNKAVLDRTGKTKRQLMGTSMCDVFNEPATGECPEPGPFERTMKTGRPSEGTFSLVGEDGRVQYFRVNTTPILDEDGSINHVVALRRDVTRRTSMENRLQQAEKLATIGELSTYIAHEIRNPLFSISGFANSLMRSDGIGEKEREKLSIILEESKRLDTILKSLLNFTRPTEAQVAEVNLNLVVADTMEFMGLPCANQRVEVIMSLEPGLARVHANPDLIKQCLINLVRNSIEAMENGGKLYVTTSMAANMVVLTVEDTGRGIPLEIRDKIFSPFFSTKDQGAGLGLAQTRKIVDELGGRVDLASKVDVGTKLTLLLPPILAVAEQGESG